MVVVAGSGGGGSGSGSRRFLPFQESSITFWDILTC